MMPTPLPPESAPLITGILIFLASLISLRLGVSVAILEIILGIAAGQAGLKPQPWMDFIAGYGGILLTFLSGTEIDPILLRTKFKASFLIGFFSFLIPFAGVFSLCRYGLDWELHASLISGIALSCTSLAVVYSVLVETGLNKTETGKLLMSATFITDMMVAIALSLLFIKPSLYTAIFIIVSTIVIFLAVKFSDVVFRNPAFKNKVVEPEIKYIFVLLLIFMFFAKTGASQAVLPAFLLGLFMTRHFSESTTERVVLLRLRTVAYAFITPVFFILGGMSISLPLIKASIGLFAILFMLKMVTKFIGVYFFAKKYIPSGNLYITLLMSTGLTFGTIASVFGLQKGYITTQQYSLLVGVIVASAVIPTFVAQKWFAPKEKEDLV